MVILYEANSELIFNIKANDEFSFEIVLRFQKDTEKKRHVEKLVEGNNRMIFNCYNFENELGTGTVSPLSIATIAGKQWFLHFWVYLMGDENVRKIEYTIFEEI